MAGGGGSKVGKAKSFVAVAGKTKAQAASAGPESYAAPSAFAKAVAATGWLDISLISSATLLPSPGESNVVSDIDRPKLDFKSQSEELVS